MTGPELEAAVAGTWKLESWTVTYDDGTVRAPFGDRPAGMLVYGTDGGMAVCIHDPGGPGSVAPFAYAGRYHAEGEVLVHEVVSSTVSAFVGTRQRREANLAGRTLTLSVRDSEKGRTDVLDWRRPEPA